MKIHVIAVGKIKEKYFLEAIAEYAKRLSKFVDFNIIEIPDAPCGKSADEQRRIESARLLEKAKGFIIALDSDGKEISSEGLAQLLQAKCTEGVSEFSFLIGGSHGHDYTLLNQADCIISFGKLTYPHQLFRLMLSEQLYRACSINANLPYHK